MFRRTLAALSLLSAVAVFSATACSADDSRAEEPTKSSKPSQEKETEAAPSDDASQPSVAQPPELDATETVAAEQGETHGNRSFEFGKGKKGDALIVAVRCQGKGTINVTVRPLAFSFPLECLDSEVSTIQNQVDIAGADDKGTVSVEAPTTVRWSMTIGHGEGAAAETL
ncbi:hypothetical protein ACGFWF_31805 [Streptomyces sp. NPDC048581]|uniref:hypothetical protein n=1 Tax=Streptomyces sp. NPDC048581 TaxID=3365572 RepID=UPI0037125C4E